MKMVGELVKTGFTRIKRSSLAKLVRRVERFELQYYRELMSSKSTLILRRSMFFDSDDDEITNNVDDHIDISGHESSAFKNLMHTHSIGQLPS